MFVNFNILNQLGSPAINSNTFANRPAAGQTGRLFVSTDTFEIYRDNGTTWDLIGGPGSSTITGTGTATQVAYFTSSQAIGSSANLYWDNTAGALGINTATPGAELDVHGTGTIAQFNTTAATGNVFLAIQRSGTGLWRIGDTYNSGSNYFELHNTVLTNNAIQIDAATNKSILTSIETYSTGVARGNLLDYTLSLANGTTFTSPNTVTALGATLNLNIAGSATIPAGARSGADFFNGINFTSAGTFTVNQASTIRAFSNVTAGWAFNGSAVGTVTHLAGLRVLFPTNSGTAINVTTNYGLLINDQTANTGTITYTNRWGIYQEGSSDLNYMAANLLLGSTVNTGDKLQVTGTAIISNSISAASFIPTGSIIPTNGMYLSAANQVSLATSSTEFLRITSTGAIGTYNTLEATSSTSASVTIAGGLGVLKNIRTSGNIVAEGIGKTIAALAGSDLQIYNTANSVFSSINNDTSGNLRLQVNGGSLATAIQIQTNANVLIGTTTDAGQKLQVSGTGLITGNTTIGNAAASTNVEFRLNGVVNKAQRIHFQESGTDKWLLGNGAASENGNFEIYNTAGVASLTIDKTTNLSTFGAAIKTSTPTGGTAAAWKLGSRVAATVVVNTTEYIEIDIGGTLYKLATVT